MKKGHSSEALTTWREKKRTNSAYYRLLSEIGERDSRGKGVAKPSIKFQRRIRQCENTHKHWNSQFLGLEWQQLWVNTWIGCYKSVSIRKRARNNSNFYAYCPHKSLTSIDTLKLKITLILYSFSEMFSITYLALGIPKNI